MNRNLDNVYFRVERDDKWHNVCFSDLTEAEARYFLSNKSAEWLVELCVILGQTIKDIGDKFDIVSVNEHEV